MALRSKMLTKETEPEEPAQELLSQRRKPDVGQFRLQVDRQTKASFATYEETQNGKVECCSHLPVATRCPLFVVQCATKTCANLAVARCGTDVWLRSLIEALQPRPDLVPALSRGSL